MEYINFGKTGMIISRFGLGCMRFPAEETEAIKMVRYAIDHGVNYIDTAYAYPGSEIILGKALKDGYREKICLVTKCPVVLAKVHADFERYLDEELKRLGTDHVDIYLLHNLSPGVWEKVKKYDGFKFLNDMISKGKIIHKGFSAHNTLSAFEEIMDSYDWEMAQLQLNILNEEVQAGGTEGLKLAASKGLPVVIMEPLHGGSLVNEVPPKVAELIKEYPEKRSLAEWCFRWLYDKPEVSVILSGTSTLGQLKDNLRIFENSAQNVMSSEDKIFIEKIAEQYKTNNSIGCTDCKYCMPCPQGVLIPVVFTLYNKYQNSGDDSIKSKYINTFFAAGRGADKCISCGICEKHCPQGLKIHELLEIAQKELMAVK